MKQTLMGKLSWISDEEFPYFTTNDGKVIENIDISQKPDVELEEYLQVTLDDHKLVTWCHDNRMGVAERPNHRVIALVRVYRPGDTLTDTEIKRHHEVVKSFQDRWNFIGRGKLTYEIHPHFFESSHSFSINGFNWRDLDTYLREINPEVSYTHRHIIGGWESGICGRAPLGGKIAWTSESANCGSPTVIHEHGHNETLHHSGTPGVEYGERDVIMGSGSSRKGLNAPHLYHLGLFDHDNVVEIEQGESRELFLVEGEVNDISVPMNANQFAIARTSGTIKRVGISVHKGDIDIHQPASDFSSKFAKTSRVGTLRSIDDSVTIAGVIITLIETDDQLNTRKVRIENNSGSTTIPSDDEPYFIEPDTAIPFDNASGIWGNSAWNVQGIHLRHLADRKQVYVLWLTWDIWGGRGRQRYYQGVLDIDENNVAKGNMQDDKTNEDVGSMMVYLNSESSLTFHAMEYGERNWVLPLERITPPIAEDGLAGVYGTGNEQGIHISRLSDGRIVGYWIGVDNVGTPLGASKIPFWRLIQEEQDENGVATGVINIYDIEDGYPLIAAKDTKLVPMGQINNLEPNVDENTPQEFDIELEYDNKLITAPLTRLA